jgi:hypothetical protein
MRILVASVLAATCFAAATATATEAVALSPTLTVNCQPTGCVAEGGLGTLVQGATVLTGRVDEGVLCLGLVAPCSLASAALVVSPAGVFGVGVVNGLGAGAVAVSLHFVQVALLGPDVELFVTASSHAAGLIVLAPGVCQTLYISGLTILAHRC